MRSRLFNCGKINEKELAKVLNKLCYINIDFNNNPDLALE
jgi:hypothetical protein